MKTSAMAITSNSKQHRARPARPTKHSATLFTLLATAALCFAQSGYIQVKAITAQWLIANAWAKTLASQELGQRPWPWLDTWPVAKLSVPGLDEEWLVLEGLQGQSLAFGPGRLQWQLPTATAGQTGLQLIAAHNDTHFRSLAKLATGDTVKLQNHFGGWRTYQVVQISTLAADDGTVTVDAGQVDSDDLFLMTCDGAFQALAANQRRLLAHLKPVLRKLS
ncbi:sortase domain-containing protein [Halioxenophilus aromaticivorans]|uniref:Class GN sortase n=1 Tax=Halioxenophilus aromaticivorans TaxID=1306992 RepID=A0AAV3U382_9ALTE